MTNSNEPIIRLNDHASRSTLQGWHTRGYLPHCDGSSVPQSITFRLADSLPAAKYNQMIESIDSLNRHAMNAELVEEIERYLDRGLGSTHLADPCVAELVQAQLLYWDEKRYRLHAWVVMPNHLHVLITPNHNQSLASILHGWKSYTANKANKFLGLRGAFWQRESFDRFIRDEFQFHAAVVYIKNNPVQSGLCATPKDWQFSSASYRTIRKITE